MLMLCILHYNRYTATDWWLINDCSLSLSVYLSSLVNYFFFRRNNNDWDRNWRVQYSLLPIGIVSTVFVSQRTVCTWNVCASSYGASCHLLYHSKWTNGVTQIQRIPIGYTSLAILMLRSDIIFLSFSLCFVSNLALGTQHVCRAKAQKHKSGSHAFVCAINTCIFSQFFYFILLFAFGWFQFIL